MVKTKKLKTDNCVNQVCSVASDVSFYIECVSIYG